MQIALPHRVGEIETKSNLSFAELLDNNLALNFYVCKDVAL